MGYVYFSVGASVAIIVALTSRQQMTMSGGLKAVIDITAKTTAIYGRYDDVKIQVPKEARLILGPG